MGDSSLPPGCSKTDCPVATTGVCLEGHAPPPTCPYFDQVGAETTGRIEDENDEESNLDENPPSTEQPQVSVSSGEPLTQSEVEDFLKARDATFITIVGDRDSGKTTLICSIYDRFLKGPYVGYRFCESRTLIGLERRSHYSRIASRRSSPDTPHTSISDGLRYFHFAVASAANIENRVDVMLSDRAGETYKQSRSNSDLIEHLTEIPQAHRVVILLDGGRVADPVFRSGAMQSVRQTIRALLDGLALSANSIVQVVTTKIDLLVQHTDTQKINLMLTSFKEKLKQDFGARLGALSFWEVAARDPDGKYVTHGVDDLFLDWTTDPAPTQIAQANLPDFHSEFDLLLKRTSNEIEL